MVMSSLAGLLGPPLTPRTRSAKAALSLAFASLVISGLSLVNSILQGHWSIDGDLSPPQSLRNVVLDFGTGTPKFLHQDRPLLIEENDLTESDLKLLGKDSVLLGLIKNAKGRPILLRQRRGSAVLDKEWSSEALASKDMRSEEQDLWEELFGHEDADGIQDLEGPPVHVHRTTAKKVAENDHQYRKKIKRNEIRVI